MKVGLRRDGIQPAAALDWRVSAGCGAGVCRAIGARCRAQIVRQLRMRQPLPSTASYSAFAYYPEADAPALFAKFPLGPLGPNDDTDLRSCCSAARLTC